MKISSLSVERYYYDTISHEPQFIRNPEIINRIVRRKEKMELHLMIQHARQKREV